MAQPPPTLKKDSKGEAVKGLQNALNARGYSVGRVDGTYGPATEDAVRQFQRDAGLTDDGITGPNTWEALGVYTVQRGDTLSGIAADQLGDAERWRELFEANRALISDPDTISPGQVLVIPGAC